MVDVSLSTATVFPEDAGTGAPVDTDEGDYVSGGHLASLILNRASNSYVEDGAAFTVDTGANQLTVGKGLAFVRFEGGLSVQDKDGDYDTPWNYPVMFLVAFGKESKIPLEAGGDNDVYLWLNLDESDGAYLRVGRGVQPPSGPSLKLGSANPGTGATNPVNRGVAGDGYTDTDAVAAVNNDADHGATASHNYLDPLSLEDGGANELNVTGLAGDLADVQDPKTHDNTAHSTNYSAEGHDHGGEALGTTSSLTSVESDAYASSGKKMQAALDGHVVPVAQGFGVEDAVHPANSTNAVQDVIDAMVANNSRGEILIPRYCDVGTPINPSTGISLRGVGPSASRIRQTATSTDLIQFNEQVKRAVFDGLHLEGPGDDATTGIPINYTATGGGAQNIDWGNIMIRGWANSAIRAYNDASFEISHGNLRITQIDAGNTGALIDLDATGYEENPGWTFDNLSVYPTSTSSGSNSRVFRQSTGGDVINIQSLNCGDSIGQILEQKDGLFFAGSVNHQPYPVSTVNNLFNFQKGNPSAVWGLRAGAELDTNYIYKLNNGAGRKILTNPYISGANASVNNNTVWVQDPPATATGAENYFFGAAGQVYFQPTSGNAKFRCLASAGATP